MVVMTNENLFILGIVVGVICGFLVILAIEFPFVQEENIITMTVKDKAESPDYLLILDTNGNQWVVNDPFLYDSIEVGITYKTTCFVLIHANEEQSIKGTIKYIELLED
jgi:hypothetical protein